MKTQEQCDQSEYEKKYRECRAKFRQMIEAIGIDDYRATKSSSPDNPQDYIDDDPEADKKEAEMQLFLQNQPNQQQHYLIQLF